MNKKFLMMQLFYAPSKLQKYISQHKHLKRKHIVSIFYNSKIDQYQLWYYTTLKWEEEYNNLITKLEEQNNAKMV